MTSDFDVALSKCNAGQGVVFCVWLFSYNDLMSLAVRKRFLRLTAINQLHSKVQRICDVNVVAKTHNFNIPLILDKFYNMIEMQKIKLMQEFTSTINIECLYSSLQAKLLKRNCARAEYAKSCF